MELVACKLKVRHLFELLFTLVVDEIDDDIDDDEGDDDVFGVLA